MKEIELTLDQVVLRAREFTKSSRKILGITGAPGAGKSTVAKAIISELGELAAFAPMDGFHLSNATLIAQGKRERKGAASRSSLPSFDFRIVELPKAYAFATANEFPLPGGLIGIRPSGSGRHDQKISFTWCRIGWCCGKR